MLHCFSRKVYRRCLTFDAVYISRVRIQPHQLLSIPSNQSQQTQMQLHLHFQSENPFTICEKTRI